MFRDESMKVIMKNRGPPLRSTITSTASGHEIATRSLSPIKFTNIGINQLCDDLGINFFMSNYIGADPDVSPLQFLPRFYKESGYATSSLSKIIAACGLAGYGRANSRTDLMKQSTKTYVAAIRDLNTLLSDASAVTQDTTLMSITIAAVFETILVSLDAGIENISKHLEGAMSVACLSLQQREPSGIYKVLLSTVIQSVVMNCWIQHLSLPSGYRRVRSSLPGEINPHSIHAKLVDILAPMIEFRDDLNKNPYSDPDEVLQRALHLDNALRTFVEEMPNNTLYKKCRLPKMKTKDLEQLAYNCCFHGQFTSAIGIYLALTIPSVSRTICWSFLEQCPIL
jgi:hypothetical protein